MRIIDKNYDYYDYLQDREDKIVFDRRGSFILTKEDFLYNIDWCLFNDSQKHVFLLLQCGAQRWLILATITKFGRTSLYQSVKPLDYKLEVIRSWKNYNQPRALLTLDAIAFDNYWKYELTERGDFEENAREHAAYLEADIDHGEYRVLRTLSTSVTYTTIKGNNVRTEHDIPILSACGIPEIIEATEMYNAIDEHFSLEKSDSESTVAEGTTNKDKIVNHGFDTKTSFRGKNK